MSTLKSFRAIARAGNRLFDSTPKNKLVNVAAGTVVMDIDDRQTQIAIAANKQNLIRVKDAGTFTVTLATPGVFTFNSHGLVAGDIVQFTTTGALPTGLTAGQNYYVISTGLTTNAFQVSATYNGTAVNTSGSQSGTHTCTPVSASIIGLTRYGFRIPTTDGAKTWVKLKTSGNPAIVDTTSGEVRRILRRTYGEWMASTSISSVGVRGISDIQLGLNVYVPTVATATITSNNTNATNGKTVTVGGKTYTLQTTLTNVDGNVHIGASADATLTNLANAINGTGGTPGTDYAAAMTANTVVTANPTVASHAITISSIATGDIANKTATATTNETTYTITAFSGATDGASTVKRSTSVSSIDPRTPGNYGVLRRQFKHYVEL